MPLSFRLLDVLSLPNAPGLIFSIHLFVIAHVYPPSGRRSYVFSADFGTDFLPKILLKLIVDIQSIVLIHQLLLIFLTCKLFCNLRMDLLQVWGDSKNLFYALFTALFWPEYEARKYATNILKNFVADEGNMFCLPFLHFLFLYVSSGLAQQVFQFVRLFDFGFKKNDDNKRIEIELFRFHVTELFSCFSSLNPQIPFYIKAEAVINNPNVFTFISYSLARLSMVPSS